MRLAELGAWQEAGVVKSNPDIAQLPVRVQALRDSKLLYMAVPRRG
jgi:5-formyltetrahydrofolate cyclo-ligase